ncbi:aspartate aminotransferase, mitochondrial-like [Bolinopsis microptera]|uniref:aspartate aminotransferase, mitochondrial-like n=1 Tax=Bolinopsis microptera TaxID=2820187 RepID=UPI00307A4CC9
MGPPDPIIGVTEAFNRDTNPNKMNVGVGAYRDDSGKPFVLPSVRAAEEKLLSQNLNHEYLPTHGCPHFRQAAKILAFGEDSVAVKENLVASAQSISGTGGLRIGGMFLKKFHSSKQLYLPSPSWGNHTPIFKESGLEIKSYSYYKKDTKSLDLENMLADIGKIEEGATILLHACAHNPTGVDPTPEQWDQISQAIKKRNLLVFIDMAYQGFASGSVEKDAYAVRKFIADGHRILLSQSFAKNMGVYGQRCGAFSIVAEDAESAAAIESQLKIIIRPLYSSPALTAARLVTTVLTDQQLHKQWLIDVKGMADRIISMRSALKAGLAREGSVHNWDHLTNQIGMFCFTGMNPEQVERLTREFSVYLTKDGRISVAGVSSKNVDYLAKGMHEVTK